MGNEGWGWAASLLAAAAMHAAIVAGVGLQAGRGAPMPQRLLAVEVALAAPLPEAPPAAPQAAPAPAAPADAPAAEPEATQHPAPSPAPVAEAAAAPAALPVAFAPAPAPVHAPAHVKPRPLYDPAPQYPAVARRRGEQGTVRCLVTVDAAGRVETAAVLASSGSPALDRAALEAVTRTPFAPARAGEEAVRGELVVAVRFQLR